MRYSEAAHTSRRAAKTRRTDMPLATRILLVDDHDLVRTGLKRLLADFSDLSVCGEAESGEDAYRLCRELNPDLVLMDLKMPGIGGLEATRKVTSHCPDIKVIAVSAMEDELHASR